MEFKNNLVKIQGIRPELLFGLFVANDVYAKYGYDMVITSLDDSKHSNTSLHYSGSAADLRIANITNHDDRVLIVEEIKRRLKKDYDVILEKDHIHIEYQPKYN